MTGADLATPQQLRDVMAQLPAPVSIVTTLHDDLPHGTTVSALTSLSLTPPMILISLDRGSDLLRLVRVTGRFGVNILSLEQVPLAVRFAAKGANKFDGVAWGLDHGIPRLPHVSGWVCCDVTRLVDGGDHVVALGTVVAAEVCPGKPLTYHARTFGTHTTVDALSG